MAVGAELLVSYSANESVSSEAQRGGIRHFLRNVVGINFTDGTGAGQVDRVWSDERPLVASDDEDLDFSGGINSVINGTALIMAKLKVLIIVNTGTVDIRLVRPAANGIAIFTNASDGEVIAANGGFVVKYYPAGITVTAGTADLINILNLSGATAAAYEIHALGTSV